MRTIGFYSFKGGVGRTNLLMNMAYYLAHNKGYHVGAIDLDLEAPGLSVAPDLRCAPEIFYPEKGVWDFLSSATDYMKRRDEGLKIPDVADIFYETEVAYHREGSLHLAPAVSYPSVGEGGWTWSGERFSGVLQSFLDFFGKDRTIGEKLFQYMADRIRRAKFRKSTPKKEKNHSLDFLLTDLRTGLTELCDSAVGTLFNEMILVSGLNTQNINGLFTALEGMKKILESRPGPPVLVTPVFSPVPNAELFTVRERLKRIREELERFSSILESNDSRLNLLLSGPVENTRRLHSLYTIHYCDYLAVDDGIILKNYPETHTAQEILEISRSMIADAESVRKTIGDSIREIAGFSEKSLSGEQEEGTNWQWLADYLKNPPSWRWPLDLFASGDFDRDSFEQKLLSFFEDRDVGENLLDALSTSLALSKEEKFNIVESFDKLSLRQATELTDRFSDERKKLEDKIKTSLLDVGRNLIPKPFEWVEVLRSCMVPLVDASEMLERIQATPVNLVFPRWMLLMSFLSWKRDPEIMDNVANIILGDRRFPADLFGDLLKMLDPLIADPFNPLRKKIERAGPELIDRLHSESKLSELGNKWFPHYGFYSLTEYAFEKAVEVNPNSAEAWWNQGKSLAQYTERYEDAEKSFLQAVTLDPENWKYRGGLGLLYMHQMRMYRKAEKYLISSIEFNSKNAILWAFLGNLFSNYLGRYEEAETAYRKAVDFDAKNSVAWNNLGTFLLDHMNRFSEAEDMFKRVVSYGEEYSAYGHINLLTGYILEGEDDLAKRQRDKLRQYIADSKDRLNVFVLQHCHLLCFALSKEKKKFIELDSVLTMQPEDLNNRICRWIASRIIQLPETMRNLAQYERTGLFAFQMEHIIQIAAMTKHDMPESDHALLKNWISDVLERFRVPDGSRPIHPPVVNRALAILGLKEIACE